MLTPKPQTLNLTRMLKFAPKLNLNITLNINLNCVAMLCDLAGWHSHALYSVAS